MLLLNDFYLINDLINMKLNIQNILIKHMNEINLEIYFIPFFYI